MRFNLPILRRMSEAFRKRDWFGIGFELFVVVVGVLLGLEASRWAADREEREYHAQMVSALDATLKVYVEAGDYIHNNINGTIEGYNRGISAGKRPPPPYWRLDQLERPPTLAWDAMVATGIARSLEPELVFEIARFLSRGDGFGDRYARYNAFTESRSCPTSLRRTAFTGPMASCIPNMPHTSIGCANCCSSMTN